jgi:NAD(P)-dependent dehydrogenase (short-subunit alcohol dehydrogenase family)
MTFPHLLLIGHGPGSGHGIALAFAQAGFRPSLVSRSPADLSRLAPLAVPAFQTAADAGDAAGLAQAIRRCVEHHGPVDVLVYNAVAFRMALPSQVSADHLIADFRTNVGGALVAAQAVLPAMRARRSGTILLTGGGWAIYPDAAVASTAIGKAAQRHLALMLAQELAGSGVRAGSLMIMGQVAPGTPFDPAAIGQAMLAMHRRPEDAWNPEVHFTGA